MNITPISGNGTLEFDEFCHMMSTRDRTTGKTRWEKTEKYTQEPEAWKAFKVRKPSVDVFRY